jgi:hypothetical protein
MSEDNELLAPKDAKRNPMVTQNELTELDTIAQDVVRYSEDDRRKSDELFKYYQTLIDKGDGKGETRESLAKALELRENSVNNLVEILKLKTRIVEKKIQAEMRNTDDRDNRGINGTDTSDIISSIDEEERYGE